MSLFPIPDKVRKSIDKLRRNFIWEGNGDRKRLHLVKWKVLISSKKVGGLGIKNLKIQNMSLLLKWFWRYNTEEQALWRQVIQCRHEQMGQWATKPVTSAHGVRNWKSIRNLWEVFIANTGVRLGNGKKISFWTDDWLGNGPLIDQFHDLFILSSSPDATVEDLWTPQGWNVVFRRLLNDWEIPRVIDFFGKLEGSSGLKEEDDSLTWKGGTKSIFSVKAAYNYLIDMEQSNEPWPWKEVWKAKAPFKVVCFTWLVVWKACLTHDKLQWRGFHLSSRCFLCHQEAETNGHLFLHCPITRQLWQLFAALAQIAWVMPQSTFDLICGWNNIQGETCHKEWWKIVPACIWWTIWKERNARCFEGRRNSIQKIKSSCISLLYFWCKEQLVDDVESLLDFMASFV